MDTIHDAIRLAGTQKNLAEICGVTQQAISKWIHGKSRPAAASVSRIYRKLGVDLRWLHPEVFARKKTGGPYDEFRPSTN